MFKWLRLTQICIKTFKYENEYEVTGLRKLNHAEYDTNIVDSAKKISFLPFFTKKVP